MSEHTECVLAITTAGAEIQRLHAQLAEARALLVEQRDFDLCRFCEPDYDEHNVPHCEAHCRLKKALGET